MKLQKSKNIIIIILVMIVFFIVQTVFSRFFSLASISPNFLVILTSSFGFMRGRKFGLLIGFSVGLLYDIFYNDLLGFYALIYMLVGYLNGLFRRLFYDDDIKLPLLLIGGSDILFSCFVYVFMFLLRTRLDFVFYLHNIIIPELIYTLLVTLLVYQIIRKINHKLDSNEKRSAKKFV